MKHQTLVPLPDTTGLWSIHQKPKHPTIVEIVYGDEKGKAQIAALHTKSSYFRMTCVNGAWGTSVVLMPVVWLHRYDGPMQGAAIRIMSVENCDEALCIEFTGKIAGLAVVGGLRILPPSETGIQALVSISVSGDAILDDTHWDEAFKLVMLSSMHLSDDIFDTHHATLGSDTIGIPVPNSWIIHPARQASTFGLAGGTSTWQRGRTAPTVTIEFPNPVAIAGYVAFPDHRANSDHVALWAATPSVVRDWSYRITATVDGSLRAAGIHPTSGGPAGQHGPPS